MQIQFLPLLAVQRQLLDRPRGRGRFDEYLRTMVGKNGDLQLPLAAFNPMSKAHVAEVLDCLILMKAEETAKDVMQECARRLERVAELAGMPLYRFGLVVADDAQGGWTDRTLFDAKNRFENRYSITHGWTTALLWSGDAPDACRVREETAAAIFRTAWMWRFGLPKTLREMMRQEGFAARFAGVQAEPVSDDVIAVLGKKMESRDYPSLIACLYGDGAAEAVGYQPLGVGERGGMRYAASEAFLGKGDAVEALRGTR